MYTLCSLPVWMNLYRKRLIERQDFEQEGNLSIFQIKSLDNGLPNEFWMDRKMD